MQFIHVTISVRDLDESVDFYARVVGLAETRRFESGKSRIAFLGSGATQVELVQNSDGKEPSFGSDFSLGFAADSLDELRQRLVAEGHDPGETISPNPDVRFFFVNDPNGVRIQFVENSTRN
jgi:lactoylglutathione lyase